MRVQMRRRKKAERETGRKTTGGNVTRGAAGRQQMGGDGREGRGAVSGPELQASPVVLGRT